MISNLSDNETEYEKEPTTVIPELPWTIIQSYYKHNTLRRLSQHQIDSYNDFIVQIQKTIQMFNPYRVVSDQDYDPKSGLYSLEVYVSFENFCIVRPQIQENNGSQKIMFPHEARVRNLTYASATYIDVHVKYIVRTGEMLENTNTINNVISRVQLGKIPIMVKSSICVTNQYKHFNSQEMGECEYDVGGYFIINGSEKVVLGQERSAENKLYCFECKNNTKYSWSCEIRSVSWLQCISPKQITLYLSNKNNGFGSAIHIQLNRVKQPIPVMIIFKALGILTDKKICEYILLDLTSTQSTLFLKELQASIMEASAYKTREECIRYIMGYVSYTPQMADKETGVRRKEEFTKEVIEHDLFPHCHNVTQKIYFLGYMIKTLLMAYFKLIKPSDRDSYINKRVDMCGTSMNNLYRNYFSRVAKDMDRGIVKEINTGLWKATNDYKNILNAINISQIIKAITIENGLKRALSTGDFGIKNLNTNKVGVAQVLSRLNHLSYLSHLRRVSAPSDKNGKLIPPRKLHTTSFGYFCPAETPEGASVGMVKNLSLLAYVTIHSETKTILDQVLLLIVELSPTDSPCNYYQKVKVILNGAWIGVTNTPQELFETLKQKKQNGLFNVYTSIVFNYLAKEIVICNDSGRLVRPMLRVKNNQLLITPHVLSELANDRMKWDDLLINNKFETSVIEYIDAEEHEKSYIANTPAEMQEQDGFLHRTYTHCEIHNSSMFGILASLIPFPEYNQSPRNTYQCAQGKQSISVYARNHKKRFDKTSHILEYPNKPLVTTRIADILSLEQMPTGTNFIVAIASYTGYNQEDSILMSKEAIERGLALISNMHTEKDEDKQKRNGELEIRGKPDKTITKGMKIANYEKLNANGIIPKRTFVKNRDIIMSKYVPIKANRNNPMKKIKYEDLSKMVKTSEDTYVENTITGRNGDGYNFAKIKLCSLRQPVIGDKFSSRHGQKGTIGNIIPRRDMPFTKDGLQPDIIINPHAIPSRMTIGQLKETVLGLVLLELGLFGDGTSFGDFSVSEICDRLHKLGFASNGNQLMYDAFTGEQISCSIFIGPVYYQRLKHMVKDKIHSRASGPMVNLTRQPAEGRSKDGGLRLGEMENHCLIAHGVSRFLKSRLYDVSDKYMVFICKMCGLIAVYNDAINSHLCKMCENKTHFACVHLPYACKLMFQELAVMNVVPRLITE